MDSSLIIGQGQGASDFKDTYETDQKLISTDLGSQNKDGHGNVDDLDPRKLLDRIKHLEQVILDMQKTLREHEHQGPQHDGSALLSRSIDLIAGQVISAGGVGGFTGLSDPDADRTIYTFATGRDASAADGIQNSQVLMEHQYSTDYAGGPHQTFMYGIRGSIYSGSTATSTGSTMTQGNYSWNTNELVGSYVNLMTDSGAASWDSYQITANTKDTLTISGTFSVTGSGLFYYIFVPIYLGSADYPWRRIYTGDGAAGGIRFGFGNTGGGQNGMLYMSGTHLYWNGTRLDF